MPTCSVQLARSTCALRLRMHTACVCSSFPVPWAAGISGLVSNRGCTAACSSNKCCNKKVLSSRWHGNANRGVRACPNAGAGCALRSRARHGHRWGSVLSVLLLGWCRSGGHRMCVIAGTQRAVAFAALRRNAHPDACVRLYCNPLAPGVWFAGVSQAPEASRAVPSSVPTTN